MTVEIPEHWPAQDEPSGEPGGGDEEEQHHHRRQHGIGLVGAEDLLDVEEEGGDQEHIASGQHGIRHGGFQDFVLHISIITDLESGGLH